jgi:hypothetical protein
VNPTAGLELPRGEKARDRIAAPTEARALLAALPESDRATWGAAMYAGLRRGELMALRANRIDLDANVVRVERGWDAKAGEVATKNGKPRTVPVAAPLRELLLRHLMRTGRRDTDLVFGATATEPFAARQLTTRADAAWTEAKLRRITLHECRHTFASYLIAAGVNAKAVSVYMGHASVAFTLDRCGHLFPGAESEAAGLLDTYLTLPGGTVRRRLARTSGPHPAGFRSPIGNWRRGAACTTSSCSASFPDDPHGRDHGTHRRLRPPPRRRLFRWPSGRALGSADGCCGHPDGSASRRPGVPARRPRTSPRGP